MISQNQEANTAALQKTIELLSEIDDLDQRIPRVLEIVAETTESKSCAFFENDVEGWIRLRYWHADGVSYLPSDLLKLDPSKFGIVPGLAAGFTAPEEYLGMSTLGIGSVVLDHVKGTCVPEFDAFAVQTGWEIELNVGVGAGGVRDMTVCIYRGRENPFTASDISLIESIAKQIRLAWRLARAAEAAKKAAVDLVSEEESRTRTVMVEETSHVVNQCMQRFANAKNPREAIIESIIAVEEVLKSSEVCTVGYLAYDENRRTLRCEILVVDGAEVPVEGTPLDADWPVDELPMALPWNRFNHEDFVWGLVSDETVLVPEVRAFHEANGTRAVAYQTLRSFSKVIGCVAFSLRSEVPPTKEKLGLIQILSGYVALAVELQKLADVSSEAAVANERIGAAILREEELFRANEALQATIDALSEVRDLSEFVPTVLRIIASAFDSTNCAYFEHFEDEPVRLRYWYRDGVVMSPTELENLTEKRYSLMNELVRGFEVPESHLGSKVRNRKHPVILDHTLGTAVDRFDQFCTEIGWDIELNIPLVIGGEADGAFLIFRGSGATFTSNEVALAETLGKQLALALQMSRRAEDAKQIASLQSKALVAEEREKAAAAFRSHAELMVSVLTRVSTDSGSEDHIASVLGALVEHLNAHSASIFIYNDALNRSTCHSRFENGRYSVASNDDPHIRLVNSTSTWDDVYLDELMGGKILYHSTEEILSSSGYVPYRDFYTEQGIVSLMIVPMFSGFDFHGYFSIRKFGASNFSIDDPDFLSLIANQVLLALRISELTVMAEKAAVVSERNRIARDLHDAVAQGFAGVIVNVEAGEGALENRDIHAASRHLKAAGEAARLGLSDARESVLALKGITARNKPLIEAIDSAVRQRLEDLGVVLVIASTGEPRQVDAIRLDAILRIIGEIVTNTIRHSKATRVELNVFFAPEEVRIAYRDNGIGFDPKVVSRGQGLTGIEERARSIKCGLDMFSAPGQGTSYLLSCR